MMLRPSASTIRLLHPPKRCYIVDNDNVLFHVDFLHIPLSTADKSTTILPPCFEDVHRMISPLISPPHRATMPLDFEMFCRGPQILAHGEIRDREGIQHNVASLLSVLRDAHRHIEHPLAPKYRIFSHLPDIDIRHAVWWHLYEVSQWEFAPILKPAID